jgi:hypothetical protein
VAKVEVTPQQFTFVHFDAGRIAELTSTLADQVGFAADTVVRIEIDESTPMSRTRTESLDPLTFHLEGGALEDPTTPRQMSERLSADVLGRLLLRAHDRTMPGFGEPPLDDELDLQHQTAWDAYCMGRLERLGYDVRKPRRLYHFRNRHGFSDVADNAFRRLWEGDGLTWADIDGACAETAAARAGASAPA